MSFSFLSGWGISHVMSLSVCSEVLVEKMVIFNSVVPACQHFPADGYDTHERLAISTTPVPQRKTYFRPQKVKRNSLYLGFCTL